MKARKPVWQLIWYMTIQKKKDDDELTTIVAVELKKVGNF